MMEEQASPVVPLAMQLLEAIERRDYAIAIGLAIMIATLAFLRFSRIAALFPREYTATVLLGSAVAMGVGGALASGVPPIRAILACVVCSATAIAFWEGVAKHLVDWLRRRRRRRVFTRKFPSL